MFVTNSKAEVNGLAALLEPGQRGWHVLLKPQISPWFHVTVTRCDEGYESRSVVFIDSLPAFTPWLEMTGAKMCLEAVQLVSPAWLNGSNSWRMDVLAEVALNLQEGTARFTLEDGSIFYYPDAKPRSKGTYTSVIYRLPSPA